MATPGEELLRVGREQLDLYESMIRSIWGDRMTMAIVAASLSGFGMGLLFSEKWRNRYIGALLYGTGMGMELYAAMTSKSRRPHALKAHEAEARAA
ncbi:MAG TPA: hypothetical protein VNZ57_12125 [Longimicrobiales bacterium]|nr:hypothetical protein [Longimicrobiales bacterium]